MEEHERQGFLQAVAKAGAKANMWKLGEAMGLDRPATETLCMDFFAQGLLEVVNLSGGVRLTAAGQEGLAPAGPEGGADSLAALVKDLQAAGDLGLKPPAGADLNADLACLKAMLGRSQPLPQVVKACLLAVEAALMLSSAPAAEALAQRAAALRG